MIRRGFTGRPVPPPMHLDAEEYAEEAREYREALEEYERYAEDAQDERRLQERFGEH